MGTIVLSDMRDAMAAIKPILTGAEDAWQTYQIKDGQLRAKNRNMRAGMPVMFDEEIVVPAAEFEKVIRTMRTDPEVLVGPNQIVFKSGKVRVTLPRLSDEGTEDVDSIEGEDVDLDDEFLEKLRPLATLLEESTTQDWQSSLVITGGQMISTYRGQIMMLTDYEPFADAELRCLLPASLVKLILSKKTTPAELIINDNMVQVNWPDDSWVISNRAAGKVPKRLFTLLETIENCEWEMTDEHKEVIRDALALGASQIVFQEDGTTADLSVGSVDTDVVFPVPDGTKKSSWNLKHVQSAMSVADRFDFTKHPAPAIFYGDEVRGLIAGALA